MQIGRFVKSSLSERKGKNSCVIEVRGSAIRCPYFGPHDLFDSEGPVIDETEIFGYISDATNNVEAVTVGGGEPLLQPDLYPFLKKLGKLKKPILLETEGTAPAILDDLAGAMMFDYVRIFVPSEKGIPIRDEVAESVRIMSDSGMEYEVLTVAVPGITDKESIARVAKLVKGRGTLVIRRFDSESVGDPGLKKSCPLKKKEVLELLETAKKYVKKVELRGF